MLATVATPARRSGGLTAKGLVVVYAAKLRDAAAALSEQECVELAAELRDLVAEFAPSPAAA